MLKWTASAQKLIQHSSPSATRTPSALAAASRRRLRRATIANKENIPYTSTPMVTRERNSSLTSLTPLKDILNVTPEASPRSDLGRTPPRRRLRGELLPMVPPNRRHSTVGFSLAPQYASTLPRYEEEYSPSTIVPSGQQLALRGLLPDPFMEQPRYFTTPEMQKMANSELEAPKTLPQKRKLEHEFIEIAQQCEASTQSAVMNNVTTLSSAKMGDHTLDKLIDAILDSARKHEKKKKPRRSFNLRRRTLLKNQAEQVGERLLSPSYTAGDDPASDLSFLQVDKQSLKTMPPTPAPVTPPPGTPIPEAELKRLPTPPQDESLHFLRSSNKLDTTFRMETPVRGVARKRSCRAGNKESGLKAEKEISGSKRYKLNEQSSYFEIGLALPSIYV